MLACFNVLQGHGTLKQQRNLRDLSRQNQLEWAGISQKDRRRRWSSDCKISLDNTTIQALVRVLPGTRTETCKVTTLANWGNYVFCLSAKIRNLRQFNAHNIWNVYTELWEAVLKCFNEHRCSASAPCVQRGLVCVYVIFRRNWSWSNGGAYQQESKCHWF